MNNSGSTQPEPAPPPSERFEPATADDPLPALIRQLQSTDVDTCLTAIAAITRLGPLAAEALPALRSLVSHDDSPVRKAATRALGQMGQQALRPLIDCLRHDDKDVRRQAIWALARLGVQAQPAIHAISKALSDTDQRTASGAAMALANMGAAAEPAVPALIAALNNINLVQCRLIAKALSEIGPPAVPALVQKIADPDYFVRREVAVALSFMGTQAEAAVGALLQRLRELGTLPAPARETPAAVDELDKTPPTAVKPIVAEPGDERILLIDALTRIGPAVPATREYLIAALNDTDRRVGQAAAQALLRVMGWN